MITDAVSVKDRKNCLKKQLSNWLQPKKDSYFYLFLFNHPTLGSFSRMSVVVNAETLVFKAEIPPEDLFSAWRKIASPLRSSSTYLARITDGLSIGSFDVGLEYTRICSFDKTETKVGILCSLDPDLGVAQMNEIQINWRKKIASQSLKVTNKRYLKTSSTNIIKKNLKFEN